MPFWDSTNLPRCKNALSMLPPPFCGFSVTPDLDNDSPLRCSAKRNRLSSCEARFNADARSGLTVLWNEFVLALRHDARDGNTSKISLTVDAIEVLAASNDGNSLRKAFDGHGSNSPSCVIVFSRVGARINNGPQKWRMEPHRLDSIHRATLESSVNRVGLMHD